MTRFERVLERDRLRPGQAVAAERDGIRFALFDLGDRIVAVDEACLRCGSTLTAARLAGPIATCISCGWRYDLVECRVVGLPALRLPTVEVRVVRGAIHLAVAAHPATRR